MNYLTLENITKHYGEKQLFDHISFTIDKGNKVALVAKNGSGKSTLLKIILGEESSEGEDAKVFIHKNIQVGILQQEPEFRGEDTISQAIFDTKNPMLLAIKNYEKALLFNQETEINIAIAEMDNLKAWDYDVKIKSILSKFNIQNLEQKINTLSGGQRKRIALAKVLIEEPDFLILDEPTNHLDLDMIEWLEEYLQKPNLTVFMITHDRYFLDRVCNVIIELDRGQTYKYSGNYAHFLEKKATREENEAINLDKTKKLFKRELDWMRRGPQARTTKAKSRINSFYDIKEQASKNLDNSKVQLEFKAQRLGKKILEARNISKRFEDLIIIDEFDYKFKKGERVGIVGPNGVGKSTFINLLTQKIKPDMGRVVVGDTIVFGYYTQEGIKLNNDKRVIDVVKDIAEVIEMSNGRKISAAQFLERFLFNRKQQQVYVSQLSGGERRRLYLLTVLIQNPNFLILDEPTNDLDILTLNVLEDFLQEFTGCLIVITHDRYFMDKLVDHLFVFEGNGKIKDYNGTYSEYKAYKKALGIEAAKALKATQKTIIQTKTKDDKTPKATYQERKEFNRLEREINKLETKKSEITAQFNNPELTAEQITTLSKELSTIQDEIEEREMRWMELAELM